MNRLTRYTFTGLLMCCSALSLQSSACAIVSDDERARRTQASIEELKKDALALREEADLVFIGALTKMTFHYETVKDASGRDIVMQTNRALFNSYDKIKGEYQKEQVLEYSFPRDRIVIGCGSRSARASLPRSNGAGEQYLVYARNGKILRTNHIPQDVQPMTAWQEAAHLRDAR